MLSIFVRRVDLVLINAGKDVCVTLWSQPVDSLSVHWLGVAVACGKERIVCLIVVHYVMAVKEKDINVGVRPVIWPERRLRVPGLEIRTPKEDVGTGEQIAKQRRGSNTLGRKHIRR